MTQEQPNRTEKTFLSEIARTGHLGRDPEFKVVPRDGKEPLNIAHASVYFSNRRRNEATGEWEEQSGFWADVDLFGERAAEYARCLKKGMAVRVEGTLHHHLYEGEKGWTTAFTIHAGSIAILPTSRLEVALSPKSEDGQENGAGAGDSA